MSTAGGTTTVADIMALDLVVVRANAVLEEDAELMDRHRISGLPVVDAAGGLDDETVPIGIISTTDLIHDIARAAREARHGGPATGGPQARGKG